MSDEITMTPEQRESLAKAAGQPVVTGPAQNVRVEVEGGPSPEEAAELAQKVRAAHAKAAVVIAARAAHEANRAYCAHLGDDSQRPWDEAPGWQKQSAVAGVQSIVANPGITPAQSHSMWMAHKGAEGWVYGEEKDAEAKTHPCMVVYAELPPGQRFKDALFGAVVRGVLGLK